VKIIDAYWEERNLGLKVCEIVFDDDEIFNHETISSLEESYKYIVAKIPGDSVHLVHNLEGMGFRYLENQLVLYILSNELLQIDKNWERRYNNISCEKVSDKKDLDSICDKIKKGLYIKGRISADPEIENGISDLRIVNWLNDLSVRENVFIYKLVRDETAIGYFALEKINNAHFNVVQAGIFSDYQNKGFSFLIPYNILKIAADDEITGIYASISSNNMSMINSISKFMHLSIKKTYIVMRKKISRQSISSV
jgi:hypothetical protein